MKTTKKSASKRPASSKRLKSLSSTRIALEASGVSSPRAKQHAGSVKRSGERLRPLTGDWEAFKNLSDAEVERRARSDPDNPPTEAAFWRKAKLVLPGKKIPTTVRLDPDVLAWFKAEGKGYQTRINAVLRSYMKAHLR